MHICIFKFGLGVSWWPKTYAFWVDYLDGIVTRESYQEHIATRAALMLIVIVAIYAWRPGTGEVWDSLGTMVTSSQ